MTEEMEKEKSEMSETELAERLAKRREENFAVEIGEDRFAESEDEFELRFTRNGEQWSIVGFNTYEAETIIEALEKHLGRSARIEALEKALESVLKPYAEYADYEKACLGAKEVLSRR